MFFRNYSDYEGERARLYRSPDKIREDIVDIQNKIRSVDSMLDIRNMLTYMIENYANDRPDMWIPALKEVAKEAEDTLDGLVNLKETLEALSVELEDAKWALCI